MVTVCQHPECRKLMTAKRSTKKFCSAACRQAMHRLEQKNKVTLKCEYCGMGMKYAGKGRKPRFCKDGHRVQYHKALQHSIWRAMTKGCRAFGLYQYSDFAAWEAMDAYGLPYWRKFIEDCGFKFNGHYFFDVTSQGVLL